MKISTARLQREDESNLSSNTTNPKYFRLGDAANNAQKFPYNAHNIRNYSYPILNYKVHDIDKSG